MSPTLRRPVLLVESETTRDTFVDLGDDGWNVVPTPPPGPGWVVADDSNDKRTRWRRIRLVEAALPNINAGRGRC